MDLEEHPVDPSRSPIELPNQNRLIRLEHINSTDELNNHSADPRDEETTNAEQQKQPAFDAGAN